MSFMFEVIRLSLGIVSRLVGITVVNVCIPRVPPRNWDNKVRSVIRVSRETKGISAFLLRPIMGSTTVIDDYVDLGPLLNSQTTETILLSDVPALIEIPNDLIGDIPDIRVHLPRLEDSGTTPFDTSTVNVDFSIYSDASSPRLNKAGFITPPRSNLISASEFQLSVLKAASERVSEILRENRRRLDAGEDPNAIRKEARRQRAQELLAARNNRDSLSS
ncbi:hypothetical protein BJ912DRAFT_401327 [Pholiota molesta]|nr:hypothetical protein BJ912DRAFT_401327 [Pholiota molesta]